MILFPIGNSPACKIASHLLHTTGISITDHPSPEITHVLADIPTDCSSLAILDSLPDSVTLIGGNLPGNLRIAAFDLLKDDFYLWNNAAITAECALKLGLYSYFRSRVLIIGWGRIGKHLAKLLTAAGAEVTILSTADSHRAEAESLGLQTHLEEEYDVIFNTAPAKVLPDNHPGAALKIDLASTRGLSTPGVLWARGLPGKYAPEASGKLIANSILRFFREAAK